MTAVPPSTEPAPPTTVRRPRPVNGLGTAVTVLLVGGVIATVPLFASSWSQYADVVAHVNGRLGEDAFWERYSGMFDLLIVSLLMAYPALIGATVTLLVWVHRARTNAGLLSPDHHFRYSPAFSAGGLLVPFANLLWCRPILEDICIGSGPDEQSVRLVRAWWITVITGTLINAIGFLSPIQISTLTYDQEGQLVSGGEDALASSLTVALSNTALIALALASVAMLARIVRRVSRQQTEMLFTSQPA